ncbi:DUF1523 family protein [Stappia sp. GBMRC 2046]|uniref:DUF1523 family protein n=1 Tax=Stappia sediminis TaxID=2692190 RepID=A0A7X3LSY1_9HYPH|nr:DUF1523 family protein [Stappia sediminis]MXN64511.1 DUF1523 family protein [Stappia sediminis]
MTGQYKWVLGAPLALIFIFFAHYTLPGHDVVRIVGTDVKRMDIGASSLFWAAPDAGTNTEGTRDVRFINAVWPDGKPRVYRNEDTDWGWPPYLKFDSSSVTAQAQALAQHDSAWVAVTHYGWRIKFFTIFPNIISIREVSGPDAIVIPWFNIAFLSTLAIIAILVFHLARAFKRNRLDPIVEGIDNLIDDLDENTSEARTHARKRASSAASGLRRWLKRWFG